MPARELDLLQDVLREPRLLAAVTHPYAVWFFSTTGEAILWANAAGAPFAATYQRAAEAGSQVRQVAGRLPTGQPRLERLRGFGGPLGRLLTCLCTRITLANGVTGLLVMALDPTGPQVPLEERLRHSIAKGDATLAAFNTNGEWLGGQPDQTSLFRSGVSLSALNLDGLRQEALRQGYATTLTPFHRVHVFRAGEGSAIGLIAEAVPLFSGAVPVIVPPQDTSATSEPVKHNAPPVQPVSDQAALHAHSAATPIAPAEPDDQVHAEDRATQNAPEPDRIAQDHAERDQTAQDRAEKNQAAQDPVAPIPVAPAPLVQEQAAQDRASDNQSDDAITDSWDDTIEPASDLESFADAATPLDMPEHAFSPPPLPRGFSGPVAVTAEPAPDAGTLSTPTSGDASHAPAHVSAPTHVSTLTPAPEPTPAPAPDHHAPTTAPVDFGASDFPAVEDAPLVTPEVHHPEPEPQPAHVSPAAKADTSETPPAKAISDDPAGMSFDLALPTERRYPLRFMWQMSADGHFMLGSDEFLRLIGMQTATALGRAWSDINNALSLDPYDHVARAVATRETWSGIVVRWPLDGSGERLAVELSGLPLFDHNRTYLGYRGFGVCRDLDGLARIARIRGDQGAGSTSARRDDARTPVPSTASASVQIAPTSNVTHLPASLHYAPAPNVLPFRILGEPKGPLLTPVENNAFNELARQLTERLNANDDKAAATHVPASEAAPEWSAEPAASTTDEPDLVQAASQTDPVTVHPDAHAPQEAPAIAPRDHDVIAVASAPEPETDDAHDDRAPFGHAPIERPVLDRIPVGVLIYRFDRLLYANRLFLEHTGFDNLDMLAEAGGLDALFVTPANGRGGLDVTGGDEGTPLTIATAKGDRLPVEARLFTVPWGKETAMALVFARHALNGPQMSADAQAEVAAPMPAAPMPAAPPAMPDESAALRAVLDGVSDAVLILDRDARIVTLNRAAGALFDDPRRELEGQTLADVIAPESQKIALGYFDNLDRPDVTNLMNHPRDASGRDNPGRDIRARTRDNRILPLALTMARAGNGGDRFYAIFRDVSRPRPAADTPAGARASERAASEKAGLLARISQDIRAPLNAIIGFADVMIGEKFGPLGNERYADYLKDIRQSGEHVVTLIDNLVNLTHIQSGKVAFTFANINLNELIEHCVAIMQPQANRDRIIIRTSLAHSLPPVYADARALRQIALNLITHSIRLAQAGGQVIVSTALSDNGDVTLRVRNTGAGMSEAQIEAALEPFSAAGQPGMTPDLDLSLTKALSEANRARFAITSNGQQQGTLVEVIFARTEARAG